MKVYLESLGCARNLVDSENILGQLVKDHWDIVLLPEEADLIVVNTCSFIASAADESIDTILALAEHKKNGTCKKLVVAGCLPERYGKDIAKALPEVDLFLGTAAGLKIEEQLNVIGDRVTDKCVFPDPNSVSPEKSDLPRVRTQSHMAYIKIAEGCSRHCSYCIIPKLRGQFRSRSENDILIEARALIEQGTRELILVAESTTDYGRDLDPPLGLESVLEKLSALPGNFRIRLLYAFPDTLSDAIIEAVGCLDKVCCYFDVPIQHGVDSVLKKMGRHYTREDLRLLFERIRNRFPHAALRTTLITGFPGESDKDFKDLMAFVEDIRFDHLGVFTYSDSDDLPSHNLTGHVSAKRSDTRKDHIMEAQAAISHEINLAHVGQTYRVLIEENPEEGLYLGRTDFQAPDVDGLTFVYGDKLTLGEFALVTITDAHEYDLSGDAL
ncbi:MAG: 30S ribosomal protein S12 methylthiotransferase RimO [Proteobacteria bacterium]|nr:30S ribosomal protein S12 methylthiotransferase RimO [Pseudomonadota bacterium]